MFKDRKAFEPFVFLAMQFPLLIALMNCDALEGPDQTVLRVGLYVLSVPVLWVIARFLGGVIARVVGRKLSPNPPKFRLTGVDEGRNGHLAG